MACQTVAIADDPVLLHWWKLDETSGEIACDSGTDPCDGTLENMEPGTAWVDGWIDGALDFDGVSSEQSPSGGFDECVSFSLNGSLNALEGSSVTISAWIWAESLDYYDAIVSQYHDDIDDWKGYDLCIHGTGHYPSFWITEEEGAISNEAVSVNTWYYLAGTYDGQKLKIYVDGVFKNEYWVTGRSGVEDNAYIGYGSNPFYEDVESWFDGKIDDVRIYDRALTVCEIRDTMGKSKFSVLDDSGVIGDFSVYGDLETGGSSDVWEDVNVSGTLDVGDELIMGELVIPTSEPTSPGAGHMYVDFGNNRLRIHNGTTWKNIPFD